MHQMSRWAATIAALCLTAACSDSASVTSPAVPTTMSANVTTSAVCEAQLTAVSDAITDATFTGKNGLAAQANLLRKVDDARAKLQQGKPADAVQKLEDVRTTVLALSTSDADGQTKLGQDDAADINLAVDAAEACIEQQAPTPA